MNTKIYYFSGTGNSLFIARELAKLIDCTFEPILKTISKMQEDNISSHIIIVFPSYFAIMYGIPIIVKGFVENIPSISSKTIVAVCSCGGYEIVNAVPSIKSLKKIIMAQGGHLFNYYTLRLPMNNLDYDHIPIPIEKDEKTIILKADKKIKNIALNIQKQKQSKITKTLITISQVLMSPLYSVIKKLSYKTILEIAQEPANSHKTIEEVIRLTDISILATDQCIGCGMCVKVCPVKNIKLVGNHPVWLHRCEMCFACHEWCPEKAISHWGRKDGVYYHHPKISVDDFLYNLEILLNFIASYITIYFSSFLSCNIIS